MDPLERKLLCSTAIVLAVGAGAAVMAAGADRAALFLPAFVLPAAACAPCAPRGACAPCHPCAPCAGCAPCDPCAPCAACGPCDPCAAAPVTGTGCYVPRLLEASANPCAIDNPCAAAAACDPCTAANPCAVENPCAVATACDPCAPAGCAPCAACAPCDPCAPMDPCAPCGPCEPCGPAATAPDVTEEELRAVYECLIEHMRSAFGGDWQQSPSDLAGWPGLQILQVAYRDSELAEARSFVDWENVASAPYISATHGERFVTNHVNETGAEAYRRYEEIGEMPVGGIVAKPSFTIAPRGEAQLGPLFLMEKMEPGFYEPSDDWKYSMVMPDGSVAGITQGRGAENVEFCIGCHMAAPEGQDSLWFLPERLRVR